MESLSLGGLCDTIPGIPDRHRTGMCRSLARDFIQDSVNVALCVGRANDHQNRAAYCGCAARGGMPDRGAPSMCPSTEELTGEASGSSSSPPRESTPSRDRHESNPAPSRPPTVETSTSGATDRENSKCRFCMKFMDGSENLSDAIFYRGRPTSTRERVVFNKKRNARLGTLHPRDQCPDLNPECVSVINFFGRTHNVGLCLTQLNGSEDSAQFCGCVAKDGTPSRTPLVCASA